MVIYDILNQVKGLNVTKLLNYTLKHCYRNDRSITRYLRNYK